MEGIPFNIKHRPEIESGKYLVYTKCGNPARIICWDTKGPFPIVALVRSDNFEVVYTYSETGRYDTIVEHHLDLILALNPDYKEPIAEPSVSTKSSVDWDIFRREAAKDFIAALFANPNCDEFVTDSIIKNCITVADEFIKQLKEE